MGCCSISLLVAEVCFCPPCCVQSPDVQSEPGPIAATSSGVLGRSSEQANRTSDGGDWRPTSPQIELVARLQRQLQSKDAEITALKVSFAAERMVLKWESCSQLSIMVCIVPHPATQGFSVTLLQEQILQLQAAAQHSIGQAQLDSNDPIFLPPAFTERASSA